jgi:hypothetical protein
VPLYHSGCGPCADPLRRLPGDSDSPEKPRLLVGHLGQRFIDLHRVRDAPQVEHADAPQPKTIQRRKTSEILPDEDVTRTRM